MGRQARFKSSAKAATIARKQARALKRRTVDVDFDALTRELHEDMQRRRENLRHPALTY